MYNNTHRVSRVREDILKVICEVGIKGGGGMGRWDDEFKERTEVFQTE